jgi:hypothetical protein
MRQPRIETTPSELRERLELLHDELAVAMDTGLAEESAYMRDLYAELHEVQGAWVMASVIERALRRGPKFG